MLCKKTRFSKPMEPWLELVESAPCPKSFAGSLCHLGNNEWTPLCGSQSPCLHLCHRCWLLCYFQDLTPPSPPAPCTCSSLYLNSLCFRIFFPWRILPGISCHVTSSMKPFQLPPCTSTGRIAFIAPSLQLQPCPSPNSAGSIIDAPGCSASPPHLSPQSADSESPGPPRPSLSSR